MAAYCRVYDSRHLQADQLQNAALCNRVWATLTPFLPMNYLLTVLEILGKQIKNMLNVYLTFLPDTFCCFLLLL